MLRACTFLSPLCLWLGLLFIYTLCYWGQAFVDNIQSLELKHPLIDSSSKRGLGDNYALFGDFAKVWSGNLKSESKEPTITKGTEQMSVGDVPKTVPNLIATATTTFTFTNSTDANNSADFLERPNVISAGVSESTIASTDREIKSANTFDLMKKPLILLYNSHGSTQDWDGGFAKFGNTPFLYQPNCSYTCRFTLNRKKYEYIADMVVASVTHSIGGEPPNVTAILSTQNRIGQLWLAPLLESPHFFRSKSKFKTLDKVFHWIGSQRVESDVWWPYGRFYSLNVSKNIQITPEVRNSLTKRKLATWLVSHCSTQSNRKTLVQTLQKYIPVDIYGSCNRRKCPETKKEDCRHFLGRSYKFYLAFENSLCLDYVTEKFFWAFKFNMVPVTYGWANYTKIAPPHSFINALDFGSVKDLAEYLLYLDSHDEEYLKYFKWKDNYGLIHRKNPDALCRACGHLLNHRSKTRQNEKGLSSYSSYLKWYNSFPSTFRGWNNSDVFTVGGTPIISKSVCISPKHFTKWLRGE